MKTRTFFLEGDLDIATSFLNSLILLISNDLHSERSMIICAQDWEEFFFKIKES